MTAWQRLFVAKALNAAAECGDLQINWANTGWCTVMVRGQTLAFLPIDQYRIKPKPREVFGIYDSAGNLDRLLSYQPNYPGGKLVRFREVIE